MPPWADYVIPIAIGTLLIGSAMAWLVLTVLEHAGEASARLGAWWSGQAEAAERRRAERATRKAVPLVSINMGRGAADYVTSEDEDAPPIAPVVQGTDAPKAPDGQPAWTRADQKALYTLLRKHGIKREELRPLLKPFGVPLSNDVWAESAPDDDLTVTPFAGRVTRRSYFETEPELEYQEPPR